MAAQQAAMNSKIEAVRSQFAEATAANAALNQASNFKGLGIGVGSYDGETAAAIAYRGENFSLGLDTAGTISAGYKLDF